MAEQINYCDQCGHMIRPSEIKSPGVLVTPNAVMCKECVDKLTPEQRAQFKEMKLRMPTPRPPGRSGSSSRHAKSTTTRRRVVAVGDGEDKPKSKVALLAFVGAGAGALVAGAVMLVTLQSPAENSGSRASRAVPVATSSGAEDPAATPDAGTWTNTSDGERAPTPTAAARLADIRTRIDPSLGKFVEIVKALNALSAEFPDSLQAVEAKTLLAKVQSDYSRVAREAYDAAKTAAQSLGVQGRRSEARTALSSVGARFGASTWYVSGGRDEIASEVAKYADPVAVARPDETGHVETEVEPAEDPAEALAASWDEFRRGLAAAGRTSVGEATAFATAEGEAFQRGEYANAMMRTEARLRGARSLQSLIEESLSDTPGRVRLRWGDRPVSGTITKIEGGRLHVKPVLGDVVEIPLAEANSADLLRVANLLKSTLPPDQLVRAASYLLVRGDAAGAVGVVEGIQTDGAKALAADASEVVALLVPAKPQAATEVVAGVATGTATVTEVAADLPPPGEDITEGLLAHFTFDEGAGTKVFDVPGTGATRDEGQITGNGQEGTHWQWVDGKFGKAIKLTPDRSGGNSAEKYKHVQLSDGEIRWIHKKSYSLVAWVMFHEPPSDKAVGGLVEAAGFNAGMCSGYQNGSYRFSFGMTFDDNKAHAFAYDPQARRQNVWYHVAGTLDTDTRKIKLYVDGALASEVDFPNPGTDLSGGPNGWNIGAHQPGTHWNGPATAVIDDVRFYNRPLEAEEVGELFTRMDRELSIVAQNRDERRLLMREANASAEKDGFALSLKSVINLACNHGTGKVTPKKIVDMGGSAAASRYFDAGLAKRLARADGYVLDPSSSTAGSGVITSNAMKGVASRMARMKPELVRIAFGPKEIAAGRPAKIIRANLKTVVEKVLANGSVPVLFTLLYREPTDDGAKKLLAQHNDAVREVAGELNVPMVDAWRILNPSGALKRKAYFSRSGAPSRDGYDAVNAKFLKLYRVLEHWVMGRRGLAGAVAADKARSRDEAAATAAAKLAAAKAKEEGVAPPATVARDEPRATAENVLPNGGFEQLDDTKFPEQWTAHKFGTAATDITVRSDATNPHGGDRAVVVTSRVPDAWPGVITSLRLAPGKYEVSVWACADIDATAQIRARLGGKEISGVKVGEDYTRVRGVVEIGGERAASVSLGVWTTASRVRVWIDDVTVKAVE